MNHALRFTAEKITRRLELIRPLIVRRRLELPPFRLLELPDAETEPPVLADPCEWPIIQPGEAWGGYSLNFLLRTDVVIPADWGSETLNLSLPMGRTGDIFNHPEAMVYVDGRPLTSADRHHHLVPLPASLADDDKHRIALHGWTGLSGWPPDLSDPSRLVMKAAELVEIDPDLRDFVALAETALDVVRYLADDRPERHGILNALDAAFLALDTRDPLGPALYASIAVAHRTLLDGLDTAGRPLDVRLFGIGHAHMDIAYLWQVSQSRRKVVRTFSNVLQMMEDHPDYRFSHSQPQLYRFAEDDHPELFASVKRRIADGRREVMGGCLLYTSDAADE